MPKGIKGAAAQPSVHRVAAAGALAGVGWITVEPLLRRLFGHPYSDPELATAFVARGRTQRVLDYCVQAAGGAAFAAAFNRIGGRTTAQAAAATLAENVLLIALFPLVDRIHPDVRSGRWPPLAANPRAIGVSVSGHLVYAVLLGLMSPSRPVSARPLRRRGGHGTNDDRG
jgi:hypothetical protein